MDVLIVDENLLWSAKLRSTVAQMGGTAVVLEQPGQSVPTADLAVIRLDSARFPAEEWVPKLLTMGCRVLGHVGHKEKERTEMGRRLGCHLVVSHSTLSHKTVDTLTQALRSGIPTGESVAHQPREC